MLKWILLCAVAMPPLCCAEPPYKPRPYAVSGVVDESDLLAIEGLVAKLTKEPILKVTRGKDGITTTTGVVRGPLDGGGHFYKFRHKGGKWSLVEKSTWVT